MPSGMILKDVEVPIFKGNESPAQQIRLIYDYLFRLKEHLQYTLSNLTSENWNGEALDILSDDAEKELLSSMNDALAKVADLQNRVDFISASVTNVRDLPSRVNALESLDVGGRLDALENVDAGGRLDVLEDIDAGGRLNVLEDLNVGTRLDALDGTEGRVKAAEDRLDALEGSGQAGVRLDVVEALVQKNSGRIDGLEGVVAVDTDGNATVGGEEKTVFLVGNIYVNGVLLSPGGGEDETA